MRPVVVLAACVVVGCGSRTPPPAPSKQVITAPPPVESMFEVRAKRLHRIATLERSSEPDDKKRLVAEYEQACTEGLIAQCTKLADALATGAFVEPDLTRAAALRQSSCDGGDGDACYELGWQYDRGDGVLSDDKKAEEAWSRGCDHGHAYACDRIHQPQRGFEADAKRCDAGDLAACLEAGEFQRKSDVTGKVTDERWKAIHERLEKQCADRDAESCAHLATLLHQAFGGIRTEPGRTDELWIRACELGDAGSCGYHLYWDKKPEMIERLGKRGCDLGSASSCLKLAEVRTEPADVIALQRRACALGEWQGCAAAAGTLAKAGDLAGARDMKSRQCAVQSSELCLDLATQAEAAGDRTSALLHYARACTRGAVTIGCGGELRLLNLACKASDKAACARKERRLAAVPAPRRDAIEFLCCRDPDGFPATPAAAVMALALAVRAHDPAATGRLVHPTRGLSMNHESSFDGESNNKKLGVKAASVTAKQLDVLEDTLLENHDELSCTPVEHGESTCTTHDINFQCTYTVRVEDGRAYVIAIEAQSWGHS